MGEIRLFHRVDGQVFRLESNLYEDEDDLRDLLAENLYSYIGVHFLAKEFPKDNASVRIDTLGIDDDSRPVIIEYKRAKDSGVSDQGLQYLSWLEDHKAEFREQVRRERGENVVKDIKWPPRLIIIGGEFTDRQIKSVERQRKKKEEIELLRYLRFDDDFLTLEWVFSDKRVSRSKSSRRKAFPDPSPQPSDWNVVKAREELCKFIASLGSDVEVEDELKTKTRFDRKGSGKTFATVRKVPSKVSLFANAVLDPTQVPLEKGFTRDVSKVGKQGTGDLEIRIRSNAYLEKAKPLLRDAYENS